MILCFRGAIDGTIGSTSRRSGLRRTVVTSTRNSTGLRTSEDFIFFSFLDDQGEGLWGRGPGRERQQQERRRSAEVCHL